MYDLNFYKNKRVFITGHTGFKGSWLCRILVNAGAVITGYSLDPPTDPNLFCMAGLDEKIHSVIGDIRDIESLEKSFEQSIPEIVFHLAAQPIVRASYTDPRYTYETNVMGTVNILECVREHSDTVKSFLNVTTDKVYKNNEWEWGYRENDELNGFDPYSNSKSCSELVTDSYKKSFFTDNTAPAISTARAGNVIGGGDFAVDRIIPDCVRAMQNNSCIGIRNPFSTRPYQHVLEPLSVYLMIAQKQYEDKKYAGSYNVGPDDCDCINTGELATMFCKSWGENAEWINQSTENAPHEANFLKLDCSRIKSVFDWQPHWHIEDAVKKTVEWTKVWMNNGNIPDVMDKQILEFFMEK